MAPIINMDRLIDGPPQPTKISYEEFLTAYDSMHAEWVDGEVQVMIPVSLPHQNIVTTLVYALGFYAEKHGGTVVSAPYQMRLKDLGRGREPDILFVHAANLNVLTRNFADGAVDLAVEVVSPDSRDRDRIEKFSEYQTAGVKEYWIIDPDSQECIFYVLGTAGKYVEQPISSDEKYASVVLPGLTIDTRWFWRLRPPGPVEIMNAIALSESEGE